ncbi:hypothetical protein EJD97_002624 [Solanum chilense]|uniref:Retrotransposon gag domain-containing protein n=1 Tax=Solanum chilense TaxID=4083 RepID=A0A6N2CIN1_SOLCI|nr:hypothetical protein EJD97_002624 [Solanum chilense]
MSRTWFNQWKDGRDENAQHLSWACFEEAFLGHFFCLELKEKKVREFPTLKRDSLSVHEYGLKFTKMSRHDPDMQLQDERLRDIEEYRKKKAKRGLHHHLLLHLHQEIEVSIMAEISRTSRLDKTSPKVVWHKEVAWLLQVGCGNPGNRANLHHLLHQKGLLSRGATFGNGGGANRLYAITSLQEQENPLHAVTGKANVVADALSRQVKVEHQRAGGLAQNIELSEWKWEIINMDFVIGFPRADRPDLVHQAIEKAKFGKKEKLNPRYIGPYRISKRIDNVAYEMDLPQELAAVHLVFHIFILKKCTGDPSLNVPTKNVGIKDILSYEEILDQILDHQAHKLRTKKVTSVKVLWRNQFVEATWKAERIKRKDIHITLNP